MGAVIVGYLGDPVIISNYPVSYSNMSEANTVNEKVGTTATVKKTESNTPKKIESKAPKKTEAKTPKKTEAKTKTPKKAETKPKKNSIAMGKKKPAVMNGDKTKAKKLTYLQMVTDAIATMKERSGSSRKAIAKHVVDTHKIEEAKVVHIRKAIATGLEKGLLKQARPTGKGAGSFRLVKKETPKLKNPIVKKIAKPSSAGASSAKIIRICKRKLLKRLSKLRP